MSGLEIVGVVLGAVPLLISALEHYEKTFKTVQALRRYARTMHKLAQDLSTEQTTLRNTCETLLGGQRGVPSENLQPLLAEPFGPLWRNPEIQGLVERRLDHTQDDFRGLVLSMRESIEKMRLKLGLGPAYEIRISGKRDMFMIALQLSSHEDSIRNLSETNRKLDLIMSGNIRNEPYRRSPPQTKLFNLLQTVSRSIYNALRSSLSVACAQSHCICFRPPTPILSNRSADEESLVRRLNFFLVLTHNVLEDEEKVHSKWVWDELVLRLADPPAKPSITSVAPLSTTATSSSKSKGVKFLGGHITIPITRSPPPSTSLSKRDDPAMTPSNSVSLIHINNPTRSIYPHPTAPPQLLQVKDICRTLGGKMPAVSGNGPYGYLVDETTQAQERFEMSPFRSSHDSSEYTTIDLGDAIISPNSRPSLAQKCHIAAMAASSILFLHNTRWVPGKITSRDVFLVTRHGSIEFGEIYLANKPLKELEPPSSTTPKHDSSVRQSGEAAIFYLGVLLMEIMLWKPFGKFWDDLDPGLSRASLEEVLDATTTKGLTRTMDVLERVEWIGSVEFRKAVEHCIRCDLGADDMSLDDDSFRQAVYNEIVAPLQDIDQDVGRKMFVGKGRHV